MGLRFLKILLFLGAISSLSAQQVYWKGPQEALAKDQNSMLELVFEDCQPEDSPQLPNIDGLAFGAPSSSSQYAMENFKITQRAVLSYPIQPLRPGTLIIPAFQVQTSAGSFTVPALTLQVGTGNLAQGRTALSDIVLSQIRPAKKSVWFGEIFDLDYVLLVSPRYHAELAGALQWSPEGIALEDWSSPTQVRAQVGSESRQGVQYITRACALKSGLLNPNPAQQKLNLQTGTQSFGFFSRPKLEQFSVESEPFTLEVKPLPPAPQDFINAVGKFKLTSRLVPKKVTVGDPITWTLELSGTGNWPAGLSLPQREVAGDFRAIEPKSKLVKPEGKPFEGILTEDVILIPTKPGNYTLGPIHYSYFDPELGNYVTISLESETIEVDPTINNPLAFSPPSNPMGDTPSPTSLQNEFVLPKEPIEKTSSALSPMTGRFFYFSASPLLVFFAFWMGLAFRRSKLTDPLAPQKEAKTKLLQLLEQRKTRPPEDASNWLIEWRRYVIQYLNLSMATPSAQEIEEKVNSLSQPPTGRIWYELWQEMEQTLFSSQTILSTEWSEKTYQAIHKINLPRQPFWTLFLPRNFFPFFLILFLFNSPLTAQPSFPELQSYQSGDFKGAEKQLLEKVKQQPNDWAARNNLGLTLAQQERWSEAVAYWTAGRLLNPRNSTLYWNMSLGLKRSNFSTPQLLTLAQLPTPFFLHASPAEWQWLFLISFVTLILILSLLLWWRYKENKKIINPIKFLIYIFLFTSLGFTLLSYYSWQRYDLLAQPTAGLVWQKAQLRSIPTDAEAQASHEIEAGTIATINKTFLNWLKITLPNEETGWIRKEAFIYFYKAS